MAAIVYFEKVAEDDERVTYRYGPERTNLERTLVITKADRQLEVEKVTLSVEVAATGILRGFRKLGRWPETGAGVI